MTHYCTILKLTSHSINFMCALFFLYVASQEKNESVTIL